LLVKPIFGWRFNPELFPFLPNELVEPFLTEHTILKVLDFLILKSFSTGRSLEKAFGQDMASELSGFTGGHSGAALSSCLNNGAV
jgi:hypothetical protein